MQTELQKKRMQLKTEWDALPKKKADDGTDIIDIDAKKLGEYKKRREELDDLQNQVETIQGIGEHMKAAESDGKPANRPDMGQVSRKSIYDQFLDVKGQPSPPDSRDNIDAEFSDVKNWLFGGLEQKATMTTGANGFPPEVLRSGTVVGSIQRPIQLLDFIRIEETDQNGIKFMEQTVFTDPAIEKAENAALDEGTLTWAEVTDAIRKIGAFIPMTEEQMEDEPGIKSLVNQDLAFMTLRRLDTQVGVGDGSAPNIRGIRNATNVQVLAKGSDSIPDILFKAMEAVEINGRANPGVIAMRTDDFGRLVRTKTSEGRYLAEVLMNGPQLRVWGIPIVKYDALAAGEALVFDPFYFRVKMRKGLTIAMSDSHASNFTSNVTVIRAHIRAGLEKRRGQAAVRLTGLNVPA